MHVIGLYHRVTTTYRITTERRVGDNDQCVRVDTIYGIHMCYIRAGGRERTCTIPKVPGIIDIGVGICKRYLHICTGRCVSGIEIGMWLYRPDLYRIPYKASDII